MLMLDSLHAWYVSLYSACNGIELVRVYDSINHVDWIVISIIWDFRVSIRLIDG